MGPHRAQLCSRKVAAWPVTALYMGDCGLETSWFQVSGYRCLSQELRPSATLLFQQLLSYIAMH